MRHFCLIITFANRLDPNQNVGPDLNLGSLTLIFMDVLLKDCFEKARNKNTSFSQVCPVKLI